MLEAMEFVEVEEKAVWVVVDLVNGSDVITCHIFSMFDELKRLGKDLELILITNVNPKKFSFPPLFAESNSNITVTG